MSRRAGGPSVARMSSGEDGGLGGRGRAAELQGEAAEVRWAREEPPRGGCKRVARALRWPGVGIAAWAAASRVAGRVGWLPGAKHFMVEPSSYGDRFAACLSLLVRALFCLETL